ncbi:TPA: ankyrin repeat domain-containing protein [Stenotrophomonas maltophilia]|nr:ankyrin repeat domain-containing protein [Stenotrophomonas maltophilia]HDS1042769.1 ankyrin repeat domain-containing protein [Stenotrophomonas maltophilia]
MDVRLRHLVLPALLATVLTLLSACVPQSMHGAEAYFEGKALELAVASEQADIEAITHLMKDEGVDPDKIFAREAGIPLVAWPLRAKNLQGLQLLLENGADPNARDVRKMNGQEIHFNNALVYAAKMDDPRFLDALLKHGGDPNTRNSNHETLMYQAFISCNQWKNIQLLVENGARVNEPNLGKNDTVLSLYTGRGGFDYAYWLLEHGADPTISLPPIEGTTQSPRQVMVEDIYWEITTPDNLPWQKKCQQWLADRNIPQPPMPEHIRRKREAFKFPSREEDIPLL